MGNYVSILGSESASSRIIRLLTYNVEWGFLKVPSDVVKDSCGHAIPQSEKAQNEHLMLIAKNIGLLSPDICFLQEIGSLSALNYIRDQISNMYGMDYDVNYSGESNVGYQGVGLLLLHPEDYTVDSIPNFPLNRALAITSKYQTGIGTFSVVGVHLKSLGYGDYTKDVEEQMNQIQAVENWLDGRPGIICGDFNNIPGSEPITKMDSYGYTDLIQTDKFVNNITDNVYTEFHGKKSTSEKGGRIDYIFAGKSIPTDNVKSIHIVDIERETPVDKRSALLRSETSDHLPVLAIFNI